MPGAPGRSCLGRTTPSGLLKHLGQVCPWRMSSSHHLMRTQAQRHKHGWPAMKFRCRARHEGVGPRLAQGCAALGNPVDSVTPLSPRAQYPFCSKGSLENVNQASEPCLPLGPGGTGCRGEGEGLRRACMRPKQRARILSNPQQCLRLYHPPLYHLSRSPSCLSPFLLGPVGVMRLALLPFRVVMRIK